MQTSLIVLLCVLYASAPAASSAQCTGSSYDLPAAECKAWQDLFDGMKGDKWQCNSLKWAPEGTQSYQTCGCSHPLPEDWGCNDKRDDPCGCNMACESVVPTPIAACAKQGATYSGGTTPCVKCNRDAAGTLHINFISLSFCLLDGTIPDSISDMTELTYLDLSSSNYNPQCWNPAEIGRPRPQVHGEIPASISKMKKLTFLNLRDNMHTSVASLPFDQFTGGCGIGGNPLQCPLPPGASTCSCSASGPPASNYPTAPCAQSNPECKQAKYNFCGPTQPGTLPLPSASACDQCIYDLGNAVCNHCAPGSGVPDATVTDASQCAWCPAGRYSPGGSATPGQQAVSVCSVCPANFFSPSKASVCTACPPGQYSPAGSAACSSPVPTPVPTPAPTTPVPTPAPSNGYICQAGQCVKAASGGLPLDQCQAFCIASYYKCVDGQCQPSPTGGVPHDTCVSNCVQVTSK